MTRILALVAVLAVGEAQAQEPIILEKIGAVHMAQPNELRRHDARAEMLPARSEPPPYDQTKTDLPPR